LSFMYCILSQHNREETTLDNQKLTPENQDFVMCVGTYDNKQAGSLPGGPFAGGPSAVADRASGSD
jgi:hypothetical protein